MDLAEPCTQVLVDPLTVVLVGHVLPGREGLVFLGQGALQVIVLKSVSSHGSPGFTFRILDLFQISPLTLAQIQIHHIF